jgi:hypothetical protein
MSEDRLIKLMRVFRRALQMMVKGIEEVFPEVKEQR